MKKLQLFEPAMCCDTGLCGVGVDPELIRMVTVIDSLKKKGITIERYNLSSAPQIFVTNKVVNSFVKANGADALPICLLDDAIVITGRYPSNSELSEMLNIPMNYLGEQKAAGKTPEQAGGCCCGGDCN